MLLFSFYKKNKILKRTNIRLKIFRETANIFARNYEFELRIFHFEKLVLRDSLLQSEQVLDFYTIGLCQYLTPAVFACRLCAEND